LITILQQIVTKLSREIIPLSVVHYYNLAFKLLISTTQTFFYTSTQGWGAGRFCRLRRKTGVICKQKNCNFK